MEPLFDKLVEAGSKRSLKPLQQSDVPMRPNLTPSA